MSWRVSWLGWTWVGDSTGSRTKWPKEEGKKARGDRHNGKDDLFTKANPGEGGRSPTTKRQRDNCQSNLEAIRTQQAYGARLYSRSFRARDQFEVQKGVGQCWVICPQWTEPHPWKPHQKDWSLSWGEGLVESACLKNWVSYGFNPRGIVGYPQATDMPLSERTRQKVNALDRKPGERRML